MKKTVFALTIIMLLVACHKDHPEDNEVKADRTVVIYISGENSLWDFIDNELKEMQTGSRSIGDNNLLIYVDRGNTKELPWLARVKNGEITDSVSISDMNISSKDEYASDPRVMEAVLRYAFNNYPSKNDDYGLVLWGHASGWLINTDSIAYTVMARRKAYGVDNGKGTSSNIGKWMNIPTMSKMLSKLPHLTFIFADCCNFQCLESAYELRNVADYIIGSPAEIPGVGAPYNTVVPAMFERTTFWKSIVDRYFEQRADGYDVPLSVIKTSEMANLANATRTILPGIKAVTGDGYPDMTGIIHYFIDCKFYDANDFVLKYAPNNEYTAWKQAFDKAVIYKKMAMMWMVNGDDVQNHYLWRSQYSDFEMTETKYGGVSMFIPQGWSGYNIFNRNIKQMGWYYGADYSSIGW